MNRAVIFDMDGVICHTNPDHSLTFQEFFRKRDMFFTDAEYAEHMYGKNNSYIMSHFFGRKIEGEELKALEEEKEGMFREMYKNKVKTIDGFMPWLELLKKEGYRLGVATSAPRLNLDLIGGVLNLEQYMDVMLASEDVLVHKPDPQVYLKSADLLGIDVNKCIVFEDSHAGVSAAINAKMKVVGVLSSHTKKELPPCDHYIDTYDDISLSDLDKWFS